MIRTLPSEVAKTCFPRSAALWPGANLLPKGGASLYERARTSLFGCSDYYPFPAALYRDRIDNAISCQPSAVKAPGTMLFIVSIACVAVMCWFFIKK